MRVGVASAVLVASDCLVNLVNPAVHHEGEELPIHNFRTFALLLLMLLQYLNAKDARSGTPAIHVRDAR